MLIKNILTYIKCVICQITDPSLDWYICNYGDELFIFALNNEEQFVSSWMALFYYKKETYYLRIIDHLNGTCTWHLDTFRNKKLSNIYQTKIPLDLMQAIKILDNQSFI